MSVIEKIVFRKKDPPSEVDREQLTSALREVARNLCDVEDRRRADFRHRQRVTFFRRSGNYEIESFGQKVRDLVEQGADPQAVEGELKNRGLEDWLKPRRIIWRRGHRRRFIFRGRMRESALR